MSLQTILIFQNCPVIIYYSKSNLRVKQAKCVNEKQTNKQVIVPKQAMVIVFLIFIKCIFLRFF